jgi:hypothetical protein
MWYTVASNVQSADARIAALDVVVKERTQTIEVV